jgi:hypothetical protein
VNRIGRRIIMCIAADRGVGGDLEFARTVKEKPPAEGGLKQRVFVFPLPRSALTDEAARPESSNCDKYL